MLILAIVSQCLNSRLWWRPCQAQWHRGRLRETSPPSLCRWVWRIFICWQWWPAIAILIDENSRKSRLTRNKNCRCEVSGKRLIQALGRWKVLSENNSPAKSILIPQRYICSPPYVFNCCISGKGRLEAWFRVPSRQLQGERNIWLSETILP